IILLCLIAVFVGFVFLFQDRAIEITLKHVGTIKAAAQQAQLDSQAIGDIRSRIEAQGATVDLIAQQAARAHELIENLEKKGSKAEDAIQRLNKKNEPPTLSLLNCKIDRDESVCMTFLTLKASTNQPLLDIVLEAWIVSGIDAEITYICPEGMNQRKKGMEMFEGGKRARIQYSPMEPGLTHIVKIMTSTPCRFMVAGNHNLKETTIDLPVIFAAGESQNLKPPYLFEFVLDADGKEKAQRIKGF
ncbi:MAG: hypothetical protein ACYTFK_12765, partial [Planctomycetota bacterium]